MCILFYCLVSMFSLLFNGIRNGCIEICIVVCVVEVPLLGFEHNPLQIFQMGIGKLTVIFM